MSATNPFGAPFILRLGDESITFPLLKMRQLAAIQSRIVAGWANSARKISKEQKLKPEEAARACMMAERSGMDIVVIRVWATAPEGCMALLTESLTGGDVSEEAVKKAQDTLDKVPFEMAVEAALRVTGWEPPANEPEVAQPLNPTVSVAP